MILKNGTSNHLKIQIAVSYMIDVALPLASNIDEGFAFEGDMDSQGLDIGRYKVTIQRVRKP